MNSLKLPSIPRGLKPMDWGQLIYGRDTVTVRSPSRLGIIALPLHDAGHLKWLCICLEA